MTAPIVDIQGLRKTYRSFSPLKRRTVQAVRGVTLQAFPGEVFGLLGPNGAGKTTLIKMLLGVVKPSSGTASLFGQSIGSASASLRVGYLPEALRVDRHHTARSALKFYGRLSHMKDHQIGARSDELLDLVGLKGRDRESVRRFSKGMYQRLGLAQALLHDPDLLILDEPTDGLDPVGRNDVRQVIDRLRDAGKTIFLNSHILQEVEMVCTRVAILAKGKIKAIGSIAELCHSEEQTLIVKVASNDAPSTRWHDVLGLDPNDELKVTVAGDSTELRIPVPGQGQVDAVIDRLRRDGHSILHLQRMRETLEQTFIRLVGSPDEENE